MSGESVKSGGESNLDNRAGGDVIPPLPKVNSLQALTKLRPKAGNDFCVFAYVLNRDMIKPDGTLDDLHAMVFPLGSFDDKAKAAKHAEKVIEITGHPGVIAAKYAAAVPLTLKFDPKNITEVVVDMKGRILDLESAQHKRENEQHETNIKRERDIMKEAEEETDPNSIEHFKRQCFLAIKSRSAFQHLTDEANKAWGNYKKREKEVRDHYARHPEHEEIWLPYLKDKLTERGESNLYDVLETGYKQIRSELLGLDDILSGESISSIETGSSFSDCDGGVCMVNTDSSEESNTRAPTAKKKVKCSGGICSLKDDSSSSEDIIAV